MSLFIVNRNTGYPVDFPIYPFGSVLDMSTENAKPSVESGHLIPEGAKELSAEQAAAIIDYRKAQKAAQIETKATTAPEPTT